MHKSNKSTLNTNFWSSRRIRTGCLVFLGISVLAACSTPPQSDDVLSTETEEFAADNDNLARLENQPLTLYGQFKEHLGGSLFLIEEDGQKELGEVLVLNQSESTFSVPGDAETPIWAVGEFKPLDVSELETVEQETAASYEGELVLHADRITLAPDPEGLSANPEVFYNEDVTVFGEVEQVEADNTFILRDPSLFAGGGIIVIQTGDATLVPAIEDTRVAVSGILRPYMIAELEEEYSLTWDLTIQEQLEAEYQSAPVLVVDYVSEPVEVD